MESDRTCHGCRLEYAHIALSDYPCNECCRAYRIDHFEPAQPEGVKLAGLVESTKQPIIPLSSELSGMKFNCEFHYMGKKVLIAQPEEVKDSTDGGKAEYPFRDSQTAKEEPNG